MATNALTLDQATVVFNNTSAHRDKVLRENKNDPRAYRNWLEEQINELAKLKKPSIGNLEMAEQYINYWKACDVICKEGDRQMQERQARLSELIKDFESMKNAK